MNSKAILMLCILTNGIAALAQIDETITGNLTVNQDAIIEQNLDIDGNIEFGLAETSPTIFEPAVSYSYADGTATVTIGSIKAGTIVEWRDGFVPGGVSGNLRMQLDANNVLRLYNPVSPFEELVTIEPDATTPKIMLGNEEVLTTSFGNAPYLASSIPVKSGSGYNALSLLYGVASGSVSLGIAQGTASGYYSIAHGSGSIASNMFSVAVGFGANASGLTSLAFGYESSATGSSSTAFGTNSVAGGDYSFTAGLRTEASSDYSVAFGEFTETQGTHQVTIGRYNEVQGDGTQWVNTDDLFIAGNGADGAPANAFTVHKNGNVRAAGRVESKDGFRTPPMGDLGMGPFTSGDNPNVLNAGLRYSGE